MGKGRFRGYRAERELVIMLWRLGFAVMRAPASGARIKRADYPDIVAIKNGRVAVFEVKSRRNIGTLYINKEQIRKLREFCRRAGGRAYIAIRIPHKGWKFVPVEELTETAGGNYKLSKEAIELAGDISTVLKDLGLLKTLNSFSNNENFKKNDE